MNDLFYIQKQLSEKLYSYIESLRSRYPLREEKFSGKYTFKTSQNNTNRAEIFLRMQVIYFMIVIIASYRMKF